MSRVRIVFIVTLGLGLGLWLMIGIGIRIQLCLNVLDVRSLAVASRSRQSEKQPIVDELALIEHAHVYGKEFPCEKNNGDASWIK